MLESLTLRNFQKWGSLHIEFDPNLTVLWGSSNSGKSTVLRALEWLCLNSFRGDWYIRRNCKSTSVSLTVDKQNIVRYRGPEGNGYRFDGQVYEALYGTVPESIANILQVGDYSFSGQFDSPLWLLLSKAEVSRQLNSIVNLDLIDRVLGDISSQVKKSKEAVEVSESRLCEARQTKNDLAWVLDADESLTEIEEIEKKQQENIRKLKDLADLLVRINQQQTLMANGEQELEALMDIVTTGDKLIVTQKQLQDLEQMLGQIEKAQDRVGLATVSFEAAELQLTEYGQDRCPTCGNEIQGKGIDSGAVD